MASQTSAALGAASTMQGGSGATVAVKDSQGAQYNAQRVRLASDQLKQIGAPKI